MPRVALMGLVLHRFNRLMPLFLSLLFCEYCRAQTAVPASEPSIAVSVKTEEHITECAGIHCPEIYFTLKCTWTSTNATNVSVVGSQRNDNLEPTGTVE